MRVRLTSLAAADLADASDHYRRIDETLAQRFLDQLDHAIDRMQTFPNGAPPVAGFPGVRKARLRRFPYGIFYRLEQDSILILRVLHSPPRHLRPRIGL